MPEQEISRGDVWWVDCSPVRGSEQGGIRSALIIQNDIGNRTSSTTIVAAITSQYRRSYPFQVEITPEESGLERPSLVLLEQLRTIDKSRLIRRVGQLSPDRILDVERAIKRSLGFVT